MNKKFNDLDFFIQGVGELKEYLLSNEIYWNLSGFPRLTIGSLLLSRIYLKKSKLVSDDQVTFQEADTHLDEIKLKWRVAWENKILNEIGSRFTLWQNYLTDYLGDPDESVEAYPREVRWRVMLQLLSNEINGAYKERTILSILDERLKPNFIPGNFLWSTNLIKAFPQGEYWYLYGRLRD